ncbi:LIM domain only protein 7-like isoform X2 [Sphaeramia orbicularis]|uniref:LIM domain only protein 7-like isoform X2 n=1 Tax=Sphaeramia orbicularis TaxID=375764 RepID=UPI00117DB27D|nr:LIM domain only protein 7-like isoform X2 [Sphaeramia orbicularis]
MEWRQQTSVSCADAFNEAQRWIEEVTGKSFGCNDFRGALENGVLLCDLINQLKPGIIKRVNRLSTPIAGLDNVSVFLKACGKLGLNESQLFHPGDLQDLSTRVTLRRDESNRRLKNVLITVYWLGRKANLDPFYSGPQLNFKAFEGLLGLALSKALDDAGIVFMKEGGYRECWYPEKEEIRHMRRSCKSENSADGMDSLDARALCPNSEGCGSDAEAEQVFRMEAAQSSIQHNRGYVPPPLLRAKKGREEGGLGCTSPLLRSKSLSDIPMVYPVRKIPGGHTIVDDDQDSDTATQENKLRSSVAPKDTEAQWQDDLTKWKNRRRSTASDHRTKSQDREHVIKQMTNGGATANFEKYETQKRDQQSPLSLNPPPRPYSASSPSKSSRSNFRPHTRALLARTYATETPLSPPVTYAPPTAEHNQGSSVGVMPASDGNILGKETYFASVGSVGVGVTTPSLDYPFSSQTQDKAVCRPAPVQPTSQQNQTENVFRGHISSLVTTIQPVTRVCTAVGYREPPSCSDPEVIADAVNTLEGPSLHNQRVPVEGHSGPLASGVSKYLSQTGSWSGSASLPRGFRRSEGSARLSSVITARPFGSKQSRVSSLPRLCSVNDNQQSLLSNNKKGGSLSLPVTSVLKRQTATIHLKGQNQDSVKQKKANQAEQGATGEGEGEKRASLSSQTSTQTNGYHRQLDIQTQSASNTASDLQKVDHSDMRVSLTLKPNSRPDFGFQTHWDSTGARVKSIQPGSPAELCQLCVHDEIVAVDGVTIAHLNYNQWKNKMTSALQTGSLTMDIRRYGNKDWSSSEGTHYNQPGQSRMTLNLTATASILIGCPDHHANTAASTESTVINMSKFNGQTDNVVQSKGMDEEHAENTRTARSKGGSESAISDLQVPSLSPSSASWSWDHEQDRRRQEKWQEEQERLLQEQYQRDQERLEAEWRRAQQDATGEICRRPGLNACEMTSGVESPASTQLHVNGGTNKTRTDEQSPGTKELKEAETHAHSNAQGAQNDKISEEDWAEGSCGFAQLSPAHRAKSLSTPALASPHKQIRGDQRKRKGQPVSKAEQERQQILEEMKKRTQLLTDNSWIRQRSASFYKEPIFTGAPLKRYESLDNLDTWRQSPVSTTVFNYPRPHSAAGYCVPSRNSSSRYSTSAALPQKNAPSDTSHHGRMIRGRRTCCMCERVLSSGAAMVIEALSLFFHLACFQCVGCYRYLGGTETGVQVRIRNRKPYCERCYFQLKSTGAPSM